MFLPLFFDTTSLGIIFCAVLVLYAGTDCICSSKMPVLHNFNHFYSLTFCHFLLEFGCGLLCFDSGLSTAVNNLFGLPLKLSSLQLLNKVNWNALSSEKLANRSMSGCLLQPGKPFVLALFAFRVQIFYANINILFAIMLIDIIAGGLWVWFIRFWGFTVKTGASLSKVCLSSVEKN